MRPERRLEAVKVRHEMAKRGYKRSASRSRRSDYGLCIFLFSIETLAKNEIYTRGLQRPLRQMQSWGDGGNGL